ncbi:MAG: DUF2589 domain-containing protein [Candidatus Kapaibacterium sp.]
MAKEKPQRSNYHFTGLPIYDIIGKPLLAIAKAQSAMAKEQMQSLLNNCFYRRDNVYEPIMITMVVTRSIVEPGSNLDDEPVVKQVTAYFSLPILTIIPINSLGIENADINFDIEFTSQYSISEETDDVTSKKSSTTKSKNVELLGRIGKGTSSPKDVSVSKKYERDISSSFQISVEAGTLPLTKGLLEIIDIYTNAINVVDLVPNDDEIPLSSKKD